MIRDDLIRMKMAEKKISQTELAERSNLSRSTVNGIVNGKTCYIKLPTLKAIADVLGVELRDLIAYEQRQAAA